jgi:hypothetical protein
MAIQAMKRGKTWKDQAFQFVYGQALHIQVEFSSEICPSVDISFWL